MFKLSTAVVIAAFSALTSASVLVQRDIWDPPVLTPTAGSILQAGQNFTVTWDTSDPPAEVSDPTGTLVLVIDGALQSEALATGFALTDGQVQIVVPSVAIEAEIYEFDLFGDSGNRSPLFTIVN